jgi:hypothetical protein
MVLMIAMLDVTSTLSGLADPWAKAYSHSKGISAAVLFMHLLPLLLAAGPAIMMDRATIRVASGGGLNDRARQLKEQHGIHKLVVGGLGLSAISGLLLFFSDVETFLPSVFFWVKLACVVLLLVNGYFITLTERKLLRWGDKDTVWNRMRLHAYLSIALWIATTLAGVLLASYA